MYKIRVSSNFRKQGMSSPRQKFRTKRNAYMFGIQKWGSGSYDSPYGWKVVEVK